MVRTEHWSIGSELLAVSHELTILKAGDNLGLCLTDIMHAADFAKKGPPYPTPTHDATEQVLAELNKLLRSLRRSVISRARIKTKLLELSDAATAFIQFKYAKLYGQKMNIKDTNWSLSKNRKALMNTVAEARKWVRRDPGPERQENLQNFCRRVQAVYEQITGEEPGIGGDPYLKDYATPFESLFLACLRLIIPNATTIQAREIFRYASGRRRYRHSI
jgi:monoamine oxidase